MNNDGEHGINASQKDFKVQDTQRLLCITDELETANHLLRHGFGNLQEVDLANPFYHLPHQLLASGLERLMKVYLVLLYEGTNGCFPPGDFIKTLGHDLTKLLAEIVDRHYGGKNRPLVREEYEYIREDGVLAEIIRVLSLFGKKGRYYNLDVVAGDAPYETVDPKNEWKKIERTVMDAAPDLENQDLLLEEYYPRIHSIIIGVLERLVRAIALQFTIGDHEDRSGNLRSLSHVFSDFRNLQDHQIGTIDYRRSNRIQQSRDQEQWIKRSDEEIRKDGWPSRTIEKSAYKGEWPFRVHVDKVVVELRDSVFCVVNIADYDFALNGAAKTRFSMPFPHDAGVAVLGRSVGPFIEIANALAKDKASNPANDATTGAGGTP